MNRFATVNFTSQVNGDTFLVKELNFFESDGTPLDLSDATPVMEIRKGDPQGKLVKTATVGDGITWTSQGQGRMTFGNFPISWSGEGDYCWDMTFTFATTGIVRTYVGGKIKVLSGICSNGGSGSGNVINVTVDDVYETINIVVTDGVIVQGGGATIIDGFQVVKGPGNTGTTIEVGDKINGWLDNVYIAGEVTNTPVNDVSDVNTALQGEYY